VLIALDSLKELTILLPQLNEFDRTNLLTVRATVYADIGELEKAYESLKGIENKSFLETKNRLSVTVKPDCLDDLCRIQK
jgi:hypothetical protein